MAFWKKKIKVNKNDIHNKKDIANHINNLQITSKELKLTQNPEGVRFRIASFNQADDVVNLILLRGQPSVKEDDIITLSYEMNNKRYRFGQRVRSADISKGVVDIYMPLIIRDNDRRKSKRHIFPANTKVTINALPDFSSGIGYSGPPADICTGGCSVRVTNMVDIASRKHIPLSKKLIKNEALPIIKFTLPSVGEIEISGETLYTLEKGGEIRAGIKFSDSSPKAVKLIEKFISLKSE